MIDLHMHSRYSNDGEFTPRELVEKCTAQGIRMMSVTDHNCVRANTEAIASAKENGIAYLTGIEIDCTYETMNFHMLGYGIDYVSSDFDAIEKHVREQGAEVSLKMLAKTQELGFHVTENEMWHLSKDSYWPETWTGEMFAEALLSKPEYTDHPLLLPYRSGGKRSDNPYVNFYWDFYAQGKPCCAEIRYPAMAEIIDIIHSNNGLAVLAHPYANLRGNHDILERIIVLASTESKRTAVIILPSRQTIPRLPPGSIICLQPVAVIFMAKQSPPSVWACMAVRLKGKKCRNTKSSMKKRCSNRPDYRIKCV